MCSGYGMSQITGLQIKQNQNWSKIIHSEDLYVHFMYKNRTESAEVASTRFVLCSAVRGTRLDLNA
jgi:hypothetical protein